MYIREYIYYLVSLVFSSLFIEKVRSWASGLGHQIYREGSGDDLTLSFAERTGIVNHGDEGECV
jgi:hypothetical protein